jgi:hypothetical protein
MTGRKKMYRESFPDLTYTCLAVKKRFVAPLFPLALRQYVIARPGPRNSATNSGIGIVTPAEFVRELLYREDLVKEREELGKKIDAERPIATPDSRV